MNQGASTFNSDHHQNSIPPTGQAGGPVWTIGSKTDELETRVLVLVLDKTGQSGDLGIIITWVSFMSHISSFCGYFDVLMFGSVGGLDRGV